jgi:hypothetical protein
MQFALLLYENESDFHTLPEDEQIKVMEAHMAFAAELRAAGAYVTGMPLDPVSTARRLMPKGDIQDGPYADTKEQLGGFYVIHAGSMAEAQAWARKCPAHRNGGQIEIRAVPDHEPG